MSMETFVFCLMHVWFPSASVPHSCTKFAQVHKNRNEVGVPIGVGFSFGVGSRFLNLLASRCPLRGGELVFAEGLIHRMLVLK
jgi:hypothetical protein